MKAGDRGRPQLLPKLVIPAPVPKPTPVTWLPPCPAVAASGVAHVGRAGTAPALTLHEHTGGVGNGALLAGSMAGVGACAGTLHSGDAQCPIPHLQWHRSHGMATKGQDMLRNMVLSAALVAAGGCHHGGAGRLLSGQAVALLWCIALWPRQWTHCSGDKHWFAILTCTASPLWTARLLLFQMTTGWGLPTAVQVRLSVSWSCTSTNAGGVSRKVGGAVKTSPDPHPQVRLSWS